MVFPLRVDDVENDSSFQPSEEVGAKLLFFFLVARRDGFDGRFEEFVVIQRAGIGARRFRVDTELSVHFRQERRGLPLVGMLIARAKGFDEFARDIFRYAENIIALIFSLERGPTNRVNRLALLVHDVVVFEKMFAGVEVLTFDRFLRILDAAGDQLRFDRHALGHA